MMSIDKVLDLSSTAKPPSVRHLPSFQFPRVPNGFALCVACWQLIAARQLGFELCSDREPDTLQLVSKPLNREGQR